MNLFLIKTLSMMHLAPPQPDTGAACSSHRSSVCRAADFIGGGTRRRCRVERDDIAESAQGMSLRAAHGSGHEPLNSSGSLPSQGRLLIISVCRQLSYAP